ncbi:MAG TPA: FliM/FliN family flagellar motor C-terminal domain-containing protein [Terracidiphilus sp.]|nr:FliM/FliN family flagellar motor C-terminal domain-containing protein [Terracidiphilus sp.]
MTTTPAIPQPADGPVLPGAEQEAAAEAAALVPAPSLRTHEPLKLGPAVARMPVELDVAVPVREFRVRDLLNLNRGQVIATQWAHGEDMPLAAGEVQLAWSEFEVVDTRLAVRVTRLA